MTLEQFISEYRRRLLGFVCENYALRKIEPSHFGMEVDRQLAGINALLKEMYETCNPKKPEPTKNGQTQRTTT